jgi:hypothetical protein
MKLWFEYESFNHSFERTIDRKTMLDLLAITAYQYRRSLQLEKLGMEDKGDPTDVLLDYVLDALGAPPNDFRNFGREFSRADLYELFYSDYVQKNKFTSPDAFLIALENYATEAAYQWQFRVQHVKQLKAG